MNIQTDKPKVVYKYTTQDGKDIYSIGLSKKKDDGTYETGFISCRFRKDIKLENKTKILIKGGWLSFDKKDKLTIPFIFVNDFEIMQEEQEEVNEFSTLHTKTDNKDTVILNDNDLPW